MISGEDRYFLERKYHDPDKPFDAFRRMAYHGEGYLEESGLPDEEILQGLEELAERTKDLPHPVARAEAIRFVLEKERLYINEHDWFAGLYSLDRLANRYTFDRWNEEANALRDPGLVARAADFNASGAVMIWTDYDHVVPDFESLLALGFPGIRKRAAEYREAHRARGTLNGEAEAFFEGIDIEYGAVIGLLDRMAGAASKLAFPKAPAIASCLRSLRDGKPGDFYEVLQMIFLYFLISESVDSYQVRSLGNGLDHSLYPFYKNDLESGRYTEEEMRDFLSYFLMQWSAIGNYWGQPFYLGGTNEDGSTRYNELSLLILDVYDELGIYNPKIQMKVNENTPDAVLKKALSMVRRKNASIVFCCEPAMIKAVMGYGATYEEALHYDIRGCYETGVRANEVSASSGYVNAAKAVEYVFTDGYDEGLLKQVGLRTGSLSGMETFEDFYFAFLRQWGYLIEESMRITDDAERFLAFVNPSSLYSATVVSSLRKGSDGYAGGVKFNNSAMLNCGFASAVDSVAAVKEFVFDKGEISLEAMGEALRRNWVGNEILRLRIRKSPHKYGNGDPAADTCAEAMADFFALKVDNKPNGRGGVYKAILHSARAFVIQGEKTGALPDGRLRGEELSKNASPAPGRDRNGPTALIRSALRLTPCQYHESFCVDLMLHPSAVSGAEGLDVMKALVMTYLRNGGQSIQFNLFDAASLRDAQEHPERYENLQVRVCGWNARWNDIPRKEQDAFILRAESIR